MSCPHSADRAIEKCPFLREVCERQGPAFARHIATQPATRFGGPVLEECGDFAATFSLFHGSSGIVPLSAERQAASIRESELISAQPAREATDSMSSKQPQRRATIHPLAAGSASISLSGFGFLPGARELFGLGKARRAKRQSGGGKGGGKPAPQPDSTPQPSAAGGRASFLPQGLANPLGGLLAMSAKGQLRCPDAVVRLRATVARMKPVRELRPQALPVKLLAVAAFTGVANLPSGALRVHVEKFSPGWILAVHATIPFIAVIRKAVVMPKWAIAFTIGSAVLGQIMGARLERDRMAAAQLSAAALRGSSSDGSSSSGSGGSTKRGARAADGSSAWLAAVSSRCREPLFALGPGAPAIVAA